MSQKNINFYELLRVPKTASVHEINQSYRKLARQYHPDKNPAAGDIFKEISYAHEVLIDENKRGLYDCYGIEGLQRGVQRESPVNFSNLFPHMSFGSFFDFTPGMGMFTDYSLHKRRVDDSVYRIPVTLEDFYHGRKIKYAVMRKIICLACSGKGTKSGIRPLCHGCLGTGHPLGSSILSMTVSCFKCGGAGFIIQEHDRCAYCSSVGVVTETSMIDVPVEKGMRDGQRIVLRGQGDRTLGAEPGDIVFVLEELPHPSFLRIGEDLYVTKEISLAEALCGFTFALPHLSGATLKVVQPAGQCIEHGKLKVLPNKGMPAWGRDCCWGDINITFHVKFPSNYFANHSQLKTLEEVLGPRPQFTMPSNDDTEEVDLLDFDPEEGASGSSDAFSNADPDDDLIDNCVPQ